MEIERKFLLKAIPDLSKYQHDEIEQGYLSYEPEIRIRKKANQYFITKKSNGNQVREEIETKINLTTYQILCNLVQSNMIKKTRYKINLDQGLIAELDIYHDNLMGLFTVEVEFISLEQAQNFIVPTWFGKEITDDKRYKNKNLAKIKNDI